MWKLSMHNAYAEYPILCYPNFTNLALLTTRHNIEWEWTGLANQPAFGLFARLNTGYPAWLNIRTD